jgi:hypothetical protein
MAGTAIGERKLELVCGCGARGFVAARFAGARIRCRSCGQHAVVGDAPRVEAPPQATEWAPRRTTPPKAQPAVAPAQVAPAPRAAPLTLDLLPEPEASPSLVPVPEAAPAAPARSRLTRSRAGRARATRGAGDGSGFEAAQAAASRDVDQERHLRAIAFWWRLSAVLGVVCIVGAIIAAVFFGLPLRFLLPALVAPAFSTGCSYLLGRALWTYHDAARWVTLVLNGIGLVLGVGGVLSVLAQGGILIAGAATLQLAWPAAIVQCLLQPRSAALCTEEYRLNVERSPGVRVAWWTSLFFIVPAVLIGLALLLALVGFVFAARALR